MNIYSNGIAEETPPNRKDKNDSKNALYTKEVKSIRGIPSLKNIRAAKDNLTTDTSRKIGSKGCHSLIKERYKTNT